MNHLIKDTNNQNIGGNISVQLLLVDDLQSIAPALNGIVSDIYIYQNCNPVNIEIVEGSLKKEIVKKFSGEGISFEVEISFLLSKYSLEIRNELNKLHNLKFIAIVEDSNGKLQLFGNLTNPLQYLQNDSTTGNRADNLNRDFVIFTGVFDYRPYYLSITYTLHVIANPNTFTALSDISKDLIRRNLGGNNVVKLILYHDLFNLGDAIDGEISDIYIYDNTFLIDIKNIEGTITNDIKKIFRNEGFAYEVEISLKIPKSRSDIRYALEELDSKQFVIIVEDANTKTQLFGNLQNFMIFAETKETSGVKGSDLNFYELVFTGLFDYVPYFLNSAYVINYVSPVFQNIFASTGYTNNIINDSSDSNNDGRLTNGRCIKAFGLNSLLSNTIKQTYFILPDDIDFTDYTIANAGTATLQFNFLLRRIEVITEGSVYNLRLTKSASQTFLFPCVENYTLIYDVYRGIKMWAVNCLWSTQNSYFYMGGMDKLEFAGITTWIPKNLLGGTSFDESEDNIWKYDFDYELNHIIYYEGNFYKCIIAHTSADFVTDLAALKWLILTITT